MITFESGMVRPNKNSNKIKEPLRDYATLIFTLVKKVSMVKPFELATVQWL
jgi:hypothetical protein